MRMIPRTHRLHGVGDETGRLAVRLGEVMCKPLVFRLLGTELHELSLHQVRHDLQQIIRRPLRAPYAPATLSLCQCRSSCTVIILMSHSL